MKKVFSTFISLYRGSKQVLEKHNKIFDKYVLIVELDEEDVGKSRGELLGKYGKYKMGDGIHRYTELPYGEGRIPVAFKSYEYSHIYNKH